MSQPRNRSAWEHFLATHPVFDKEQNPRSAERAKERFLTLQDQIQEIISWSALWTLQDLIDAAWCNGRATSLERMDFEKKRRKDADAA
jgi:hypothetical protein